MKLRNKLLLISTITLITSALAYTGLWFLTKKVAEESVSAIFSNLKKQPSIKYITFDLKSSCFPKLCVKVSNIKAKTTEGFNGNKKGFEISAFVEKPLIFTRNNLLSTNLEFKKKQGSYDIHSKDLMSNQTVDMFISADLIDLNISKNKSTLNIKNADIEAMSNNAPFTTILNLNSLTAELDNTTEATKKDSISYIIRYTLSGLNIYSKKSKTPIKSIKHSTAAIAIKDVPKTITANIGKIKKDKRAFILESLQAMADNGTEVLIHDFKATTNKGQYILKAQTLINPNYYLLVNADLNLKFTAPHPAQKILKAYKIGKQNDTSYILNIRTENNMIVINKKIKLPTAYFKPGVLFKNK